MSKRHIVLVGAAFCFALMTPARSIGPTGYYLSTGFNVLDVANDTSGAILSNNPNPPTGSGLGGTNAQERGIAVRPAIGEMPMIAYIARGAATTGDSRDATTAGKVAAIILGPRAVSGNPNSAQATSNYIDTGVIGSSDETNHPISFCQSMAYDPVTDKVWLIARSSAPMQVFSIPGGTLGGGGGAGLGTSLSNPAAQWEFEVANDIIDPDTAGGTSKLAGSGRDIAVKTIGGLTYVAVALGNHLEVWSGNSGGIWTRVYATRRLPAQDSAASRSALSSSTAPNAVAIDDDGHVYVNVQSGSPARAWRFPLTLPGGYLPGTLADVDDRALGGTNGGAVHQMGLPVVVFCPIGPLTNAAPPNNQATGINTNGLNNLEAFTAGDINGLFISFLPAVTRRGVGRCTVKDDVSTDGYPYVAATVEDAFGSAGNVTTQDVILNTLMLRNSNAANGPVTQPSGSTNGLLYTQFMPMGGDGSGHIYGNGFVCDTGYYPSVNPAKTPQIPPTAALMDVIVPPLGTPVKILNAKATPVGAKAVLYSWDTDVISTSRVLRGTQSPRYEEAAYNVAISTTGTNHIGLGTIGLTGPGTVRRCRYLSWAPGYRTGMSGDIQFKTLEVMAGAAVKSSPSIYGGITYFGSDDGKLYAMDVAAGTPVAGFPYDTRAFDGSTTRKIQSRPALRFLADGLLYLFFTTDDGYVYCLKPDGSMVWRAAPPLSGATGVTSTPAIKQCADPGDPTVKDYVFVAEANGTEARVYKFDGATGSLVGSSASFGTGVVSSPAIDGGVVFVGFDGGPNGLVGVTAYDFTAMTNTAPAEGISAAPYILYAGAGSYPFPVAYVGSKAGNMYAVNASNGQPVSGFDADGQAVIATGVELSSPFVYQNKVYVGGNDNKVYRINADDGAGVTTLATLTIGKAVTGGVTVNPGGAGGNGTLCWGSTDGFFYQMDLTNPLNFTAYQVSSTVALNTAPAIDRINNQCLIGADDGQILRFPAL
jgi:outer membrane protein assembly factor BamB